jgi:hypothetical protein
MKHLFNNLSEEEKKIILEQHYQNIENIDEQLGQKIKAGVQGITQKVGAVGANVGKTLTGGINRAPDIDANFEKLQSWSKWMQGQVESFKSTLNTLITNTTSSKNASIPVYKTQVTTITSSIDSVLKLLPEIEKGLNAIVSSQLPNPETATGTTPEKPAEGEATANK